jgi:hypothetical protein
MRLFSHRALLLFSALLVMVLCVHFGMTLAYLTPLNPILLHIAPVVEGYMAPWFAQDWRLFAPHPIDETRKLMVSCRLQQADGRTVETAWADVSTPLWEAQTRQHFSSAAWLVRPQMQAVQIYLNPNETLNALELHRTMEDSEVNQLADALRSATEARRTFAIHILTRISAAYCDSWYGADRTMATRVGLAVLRFPRFSQRHLPDADGTWRFYSFEWMPYERVSPLSGASK